MKNKNKKILVVLLSLSVLSLYLYKDDISENLIVDSYSLNKCYDLSFDQVDYNDIKSLNTASLDKIKNKMKSKNMKMSSIVDYNKYNKLLHDEKEVTKFSFPWLYKGKNLENHIFASLLNPELVIETNTILEKKEVSCFSNDSATSLSVGMCIKVKNPLENSDSYYKIVSKKDQFFSVEGIYDSHYEEILLSSLSASPVFNLYYPNKVFPQKKAIKFIEENASQVLCPSDIVVKYKIGDCVKDVGVIQKIDIKSGIIEVENYFNKKSRHPANKNDFIKSKNDQSIFDIFFYEQELYKKDLGC